MARAACLWWVAYALEGPLGTCVSDDVDHQEGFEADDHDTESILEKGFRSLHGTHNNILT